MLWRCLIKKIQKVSLLAIAVVLGACTTAPGFPYQVAGPQSQNEKEGFFDSTRKAVNESVSYRRYSMIYPEIEFYKAAVAAGCTEDYLVVEKNGPSITCVDQDDYTARPNN